MTIWFGHDNFFAQNISKSNRNDYQMKFMANSDILFSSDKGFAAGCYGQKKIDEYALAGHLLTYA